MDNGDAFQALLRVVDNAQKRNTPMIKLTKLKEADNPRHPNNIADGHVVTGLMLRPVRVGESFYVGYHWATSVVQEILSENTFRTMNSIYKWETV